MNQRTNKKSETQLLDVGLLPPQAVELEEIVLGAILLENEVMQTVMGILKPESFYKEAHERIFAAAIRLYKKSIPVDIATMFEELHSTGELEKCGGAYYISTLTGRVASSANTEFHARIIAQRYLKRQLISVATSAIQQAYDPSVDCFDAIEGLEKSITGLNLNFTTTKTRTMASLWNEILEKNEIVLKQEGITGVPTGFKKIDKFTGGWQKTDLIIIAARPAMGKTALVLTMARNAAVDFKKPIAMFSIEMSAFQLGVRAFASESNRGTGQFTRIGIPTDEMTALSDQVAPLINSPLYIDDTPGISMFEIRSRARKLVAEKGVELIIVDYLQIASGERHNNGNREQEISGISRELKKLAKELNVPVIALSQLSRAVETRGGNKRPQLSDLRESGAIEQDADVVVFIHRPEYYGVTEYEDGGGSTIGMAEIIFAKHRNGGVGEEQLRFIAHQTKFMDVDYEAQFAPLKPSKAFDLDNSTSDDLPF